MENHQREHVKTNLVRLINCTKVSGLLMPSLVSKGFLHESTSQKIKNENSDDFSLAAAIYTECMKSPKYDLLIECFEESGNGDAAEILKNIYKTSTSNQPPPTSTANFADFVVADNHVKEITKVLMDGLRPEFWKAVKTTWFSQNMQNDIGEHPSLRLDIINSLKVWISGTKSDSRLFSKIIEAFEDYPAVTGETFFPFLFFDEQYKNSNYEHYYLNNILNFL